MSDDLSVEQLISLREASSEALAAHIICYKTLVINKNLALACMKELAFRRTLGEDFSYEEFIEEEIGKFPKYKINTTNLTIGSAIKTNLQGFIRDYVK